MPDIDIRELGQDRSIVEATFKKTAPTATRSHRRVVNGITSEISKEDHSTVADKFTVETVNVPKLDMLQQVIQHNIDGDKATGTLVRSTEQTHRLNQADEAAKLAFEVIDKGYANLPSGQRRQLQERVLPAMMRYWPELNTAFGSMNRRQRQEAMDDILRDPRFIQNLTTILSEIQTKYVTPEGLDKASYDEKKEAYEKQRLEQTKVNREYAAAVSHTAEFSGTGDKATELAALPPKATLEAASTTAERELRLLQNEAARVSIEIRDHERSANYGGTDATKLALAATAAAQLPTLYARRQALEQTEMPNKERDKGIIDAQKNRRAELEREQAEAAKNESDLLTRKEELDREVDKLYRDMLTAQADVSINKLDKAAKEKGLVVDLQSAFARAAERVVKERATAAEMARDTLLKEIPDKALATGLRNRWVDDTGKIRKDLVKSEYKKLIGGDINDVVADMLVDQGKMRRAEADYKLAKNDEWAKEARREAATELMTRFIQSGNKMKPEEVRKLMNSELSVEIVGNALDNDKTMKAKLEELKAALPEEKKSMNWSEALTKMKLPRVTMHQLLMATLIGGGIAAGGFFAGPTVLSYLIPKINHAAARWVKFYHQNPGLKHAVDTAKDLPHPDVKLPLTKAV